MEGVYLISITVDELKTMISETVVKAIKDTTKVKIRLSNAAAARELGVAYNTFMKMLQVTGREYICSDEIKSFKSEYHEKASELRQFKKKSKCY